MEIKIGALEEKYKIIVMAILLAGACFLTYYFHVVLETGVVFTHFFYIPIILAALWWRRKGMVVAIFLALLLIFSHIFVREDVVTTFDYSRALMFIVIAFVVATLSERIAKAQGKAAHLNAILRGIRNVNQLIAREKDRDRMIQKACKNLIETEGYYSAWIALVDENGRFLTAAEAGLEESFFSPVVEMMKRGEFTWCGQKALKHSGVKVIEDVTAADCADCPLVGSCSGRAGMTARLEYGARIYGILYVSTPAEMAIDADEQLLFNEVAGDIAFGLHNLEQEEELRKHRDHLEELVKERTKELRKERDYTRHLIESSPDVQITLDKEDKIMDVNATFEKVAGQGREDLIGRSIYEYLPKDVTEKAIAEIFEKGKVRNIELVANILGKEALICNFSGTVFTTPKGELGIYITGSDITERKQAEKRIEHLNSVLKAIRNVNQLIIMEKDRDSLLQKACDAMIEARGYDAAWLGFLRDENRFATVKGSGFSEEVSRFSEHVMSGDHPPCIRNALAQEDQFMLVDKSRECGDCFFKNACRDNEVAIISVEHAGRLFGLFAVALAPDVAADEEEKGLLKEVAGDIALALHAMEMEEERKRAEDQIEASLKEKEVLLREIYHRVKNNLQIISSMLYMQASKAKDKNVVESLLDSRSRIQTMSLIHTQLYQSENLEQIEMGITIRKLVSFLFQIYAEDKRNISSVITAEDIILPISQAIPCGLIINELVSNALKHAFKGMAKGSIEISMRELADDRIKLTVKDNGVGIPKELDIYKTDTLGLKIVRTLAEEQLKGRLGLIRNKGAEIHIEFKSIRNYRRG